MATRPTVGRTVHYRTDTKREPLAAIVTAVPEKGGANDENIVTLTVFTADGGRFAAKDCPMGQTDASIHAWWEWPPRE